MTAEQLALAPVHADDPVESSIAAQRVAAKRQFDLVLVTLYRAGKPLTDDQIAERAGLLRTSAGTRRGIARDQGLVEKAGRGLSAHGNPASKWQLTDDGARLARRLLGLA